MYFNSMILSLQHIECGFNVPYMGFVSIINVIPSRNCHPAMVEGCGCPYDLRHYVVGGCLPMIGSPMTNCSQVRGQTKRRLL